GAPPPPRLRQPRRTLRRQRPAPRPHPAHSATPRRRRPCHRRPSSRPAPLAPALPPRRQRLHRPPAPPPAAGVPPPRFPTRPLDPARLAPHLRRHVSGPHHHLPHQAEPRSHHRPPPLRTRRRSLPGRLVARPPPCPAPRRPHHPAGKYPQRPPRRVPDQTHSTKHKPPGCPILCSFTAKGGINRSPLGLSPRPDRSPAIPHLPAALRILPRGLRQLGGLRSPHCLGQASALERYAPHAWSPGHLVRDLALL